MLPTLSLFILISTTLNAAQMIGPERAASGTKLSKLEKSEDNLPLIPKHSEDVQDDSTPNRSKIKKSDKNEGEGNEGNSPKRNSMTELNGTLHENNKQDSNVKLDISTSSKHDNNMKEEKLKEPLNKVTSNETYIFPVPDKLDSGALLRGFYVFVGFSTLALLYVIFRTCRVHNGAIRQNTVRKYGVVTERSDIEMLPLPLDDDEDDDTVFDMGSHRTNR